MRRQLCWSERLEDGVKREVRVTFHGRGELKWQSKRSDAEAWDYGAPSAADWAELDAHAEDWYRRGRLPLVHRELVRRLRANAASAGGR